MRSVPRAADALTLGEYATATQEIRRLDVKSSLLCRQIQFPSLFHILEAH